MVQGTAGCACNLRPKVLQPRLLYCNSVHPVFANTKAILCSSSSRTRFRSQHCKILLHRSATRHRVVCTKRSAQIACKEPHALNFFRGDWGLQRRSLLAWTAEALAAVCRTVSLFGKPASQAAEGPGRGRRFFLAVPPRPKVEDNEGAMRVYLISDIHTDYEENLEWIRDLSETSFQNDALIVAGDVSDSIPIFEETFRILRPKFAHVFFTPGNHDLWLRTPLSKPVVKAPETLRKPAPEPAIEATTPQERPVSQAQKNGSPQAENRETFGGESRNGSDEAENSIDKLAVLFKICEQLGVDTRPKFLRAPGKSKGSQLGSEDLTDSRCNQGLQVEEQLAESSTKREQSREETDSLAEGMSERSQGDSVSARNAVVDTAVNLDASSRLVSECISDTTRGPSTASKSETQGRSMGLLSRSETTEDSHVPEESSRKGEPKAAEELDLRAEASEHAGVWVVPILAWHHISFDTEPDITGYNIPPVQKVAKDYKVCKWPSGWDPMTESVALSLDAMNEELHKDFDPSSTPGSHVITFSHFLPRLELIPEKRFLFYPNLAKAVGSHSLEARVRAIHAKAGRDAPACHLFGHTHFVWDSTIDKIRYIQAPLAYPKERKRRMNGGVDWLPLCVYDSSRGGVIRDQVTCHWSEYYRTHPREPNNFEFAPWVANLWRPEKGKQHAKA